MISTMVPLRDLVTVQRGVVVVGSFAGRDLDWTTPVETVVSAAVYEDTAAASSREVEDRATETRWRIVLPADADVLPTDRIEWHGVTFEMIGDIRMHRDHLARPHHLEGIMSRVGYSGRVATMLDQPLT